MAHGQVVLMVLLPAGVVSCANILGLSSDDDLRFQDSGGAGDAADAASADAAEAEAAVCPGGTITFATAGVSSAEVPPGCTHVAVHAVGGGGGNCQGPAQGGAGALVTATISVAAMTTLTVFVGARGGDLMMVNTISAGGEGGANGGEADPEIGSAPGSAGGGGGGSSEVALCPTGLMPGMASMCSQRLVVAAGGGGCDYSSNVVGGAGGQVGSAGKAASTCGTVVPASWAGQGALQTMHGAGGSGAGSLYMNGGSGTAAAGGVGQWGSGGGGGGYFSGGGGAGADVFAVTSGGGGGASWVDPTVGSLAVYTTDTGAGPGSVILTWQP
jgi:hypothetical protein